MPSSKTYFEFIQKQLSALEEVTYRAMMSEYIICYRGKIVGGIYDDRLLVKPMRTAKALMPAADCEAPYEGAKEMLMVDNVDDRRFLKGCFARCMRNCPRPIQDADIAKPGFALKAPRPGFDI